MTHLYTYLDPILARAAMLSLALILAACGIGELLARGPFADLVAAGHRFVEQLGHKLDREGRKPAILIYRGIIAFFILTLPCVAIGMALERLGPWRELVIFVFFLLWFGHNLQFIRLVALWRRGEREGLPLEIPGVDFLFADSHAVIRYLIETRLTYFAIYLVGASFWYALFGLPLALSYMVLACAAQAYHPRRVFGWAIRNLFQLMDAIPQCIARVLLTLAALFTRRRARRQGLSSNPGASSSPVCWRSSSAGLPRCRSPSGQVQASRGWCRNICAGLFIYCWSPPCCWPCYSSAARSLRC